jgi:hypothetical protein
MSKICCQIAVKARNVSNTHRLKPLVEVLEQSWGSSKLFGMPKGGLDTPCPLVSVRVFPVLESALYCPYGVVVFRSCSPALLYGLLYKQTLYSSV